MNISWHINNNWYSINKLTDTWSVYLPIHGHWSFNTWWNPKYDAMVNCQLIISRMSVDMSFKYWPIFWPVTQSIVSPDGCLKSSWTINPVLTKPVMFIKMTGYQASFFGFAFYAPQLNNFLVHKRTEKEPIPSVNLTSNYSPSIYLRGAWKEAPRDSRSNVKFSH